MTKISAVSYLNIWDLVDVDSEAGSALLDAINAKHTFGDTNLVLIDAEDTLVALDSAIDSLTDADEIASLDTVKAGMMVMPDGILIKIN